MPVVPAAAPPVRPSPAPLRIDALRLVGVTADSAAQTITWEHWAEIPFGEPTA